MCLRSRFIGPGYLRQTDRWERSFLHFFFLVLSHHIPFFSTGRRHIRFYGNMSADLEKKVEVVQVEEQFVTAVGEPLERTIKAYSSVDSHHHDDATQIIETYIAQGGAQEWAEFEEKRLRRKIDWRLVPVLCFTLFLQFYDKNIIAQAVRSSRQTPQLAV